MTTAGPFPGAWRGESEEQDMDTVLWEMLSLLHTSFMTSWWLGLATCIRQHRKHLSSQVPTAWTSVQMYWCKNCTWVSPCPPSHSGNIASGRSPASPERSSLLHKKDVPSVCFQPFFDEQVCRSQPGTQTVSVRVNAGVHSRVTKLMNSSCQIYTSVNVLSGTAVMVTTVQTAPKSVSGPPTHRYQHLLLWRQIMPYHCMGSPSSYPPPCYQPCICSGVGTSDPCLDSIDDRQWLLTLVMASTALRAQSGFFPWWKQAPFCRCVSKAMCTFRVYLECLVKSQGVTKLHTHRYASAQPFWSY